MKTTSLHYVGNAMRIYMEMSKREISFFIDKLKYYYLLF